MVKFYLKVSKSYTGLTVVLNCRAPNHSIIVLRALILMLFHLVVNETANDIKKIFHD